MLCFDYWKLKPKQQRTIWDNCDWIAQEKINGIRVVVHFVRGVGVFAHSRVTSARTFRRIELTEHLLFTNFVPNFTATIDTEVSCGKDEANLQRTAALLRKTPKDSKHFQKEHNIPLVAYVFDITNWQGADLKQKRLCERLSYLPDFRAAISNAQLSLYFEFPPIFFQGKRAIFNKITAERGEGIVLKNLNSSYKNSSSRCRYSWVKVKRQMEMDGYVSGFERGRPGSNWETKPSF